MSRVDWQKFTFTEKQRQFSTDFFQDAEHYEVWDEIDFSNLEEVDGEQAFEIKAEDLRAYALGGMDDNPLLTDEEHAKRSGAGGLLAHPIFVTQIIFWCVGRRGRGNWIRTPGARNPGQYMEFYEDFRVGEVIHAKLKPHDRYVKRGKYYLEYRIDLYNQHNIKKCSCISTLILPRTREDIRKFLQGMRGVAV